jgi:hypothetical protein
MPYAKAVFADIEDQTEAIIWEHELLAPSRTAIEDLEKQARNFDFAVFILTGVDERKMRGATSPVPRDNLLFELGLFVGLLGRERVFYFISTERTPLLPTDILGTTGLEFTPRENRRAAVTSSCEKLLRAIERVGVRSPSSPTGFWGSARARHEERQDARSLIARTQERLFVSGITLTFIIQHCQSELESMISRGLPVDLVIAADTPFTRSVYARYSPEIDVNLPLACRRYRAFRDAIHAERRHLFRVYSTAIPLTHSIGMYDNIIHVSEFCIDTDSARVPSYQLAESSPGYETYLKEVRLLLQEGRPLD